MLTAKENFLETIHGGKPDRFVKQYEALSLLRGDPVGACVRGNQYKGMEPMTDGFGVRILWPANEPGAIPDQTVHVLKDVTEWKKNVNFPDVIGRCSAKELWEPYLEKIAQVDREDKLLMMIVQCGIFERLHYLMGFEDSLCNFLLEPEAMTELADAIGEHRLEMFKIMNEYAHPDVILSHDDWGSKYSLFLKPDIWRETIKPATAKGYNYLHEKGVIIIHHSDSFGEPLVEDMVDLHIDIWQGVIPQNDIPKLQKQLNGRMALMGGLDAAVVDRADATEEEIRAHVRHACKEYAANGYFIPCITYGGPGCINAHSEEIINDEIDRCSAEFFLH